MLRFILDGKLATMYSSGSPEGGSDSSENRGEFLEKLQRARAAVKGPQMAFPVLSRPSAAAADVIAVGNWNLSSTAEGELTIINSDGQQQATVLKEDLPGFVFQSNRGTKHTFTAETSLGPEFSAGWSGKKTKRLRGKAEQVKQRVRSTAREIYENYFRTAQAKPRGVVASLNGVVARIDGAIQGQATAAKDASSTWKEDLGCALEELSELLEDETNVSAFELHSSGLIQVRKIVQLGIGNHRVLF